MNSEKLVGSFSWPFCSYDVLMPKQITKDLFEWLYLSLIVCKNKENNYKVDDYRKDTRIEVRKILKNKFASLIDDITLDHIIETTEKEFVIKDLSTKEYGKMILKQDTLSFLDTYDDLFSSQVEINRVFVDSLTGAVVPCFKDMSYPKETKDDNILKLAPLYFDKPSKMQIKYAFQAYNKLNKICTTQLDDYEEFGELVDPDAEVDYQIDDNFDANNSKEKPAVVGNGNDFNVFFLDKTKITYDLEIEVYSDTKKLYINTPFDRHITYEWINNRMKKARTICNELDEYLKTLENQYCIKEQEIQDIVYSKDVASQLKYCESLYRLVETFPPTFNDAKKLVIKIDNTFASHDEGYYNNLGKYLECLVNKLKDNSDKEIRKNTSYYFYCNELRVVCSSLNVDVGPMINEDIYAAWKKGRDAFKADVASLFINNVKMKNNVAIYPKFVSDIYYLYTLRNKHDHYNEYEHFDFDKNQINKLFNITKVLLELV